MELLYQLCDRFSESVLVQQWRSVLDLYAEIERHTTQFQDDYNIYCPTGCGTCCEHFVPELTALEASLIAAYILFVKNDPALIKCLEDHTLLDAVCPLYNPSSAFHCTIYPVRGMICRLFGVCPSSDKTGLPIFLKCKHNQDANQTEKYESRDFIHGPVPTMQQFAVQFSMLDPNHTTQVLNEAVLSAIARLQLLANYIDSADLTEDSGPTEPAPIAS